MKQPFIFLFCLAWILLSPPAGKPAARWVESTWIGGATIMGIASYELDNAWAVSSDISGGIYYFDGTTWSLQTGTGTPLKAIDADQEGNR